MVNHVFSNAHGDITCRVIWKEESVEIENRLLRNQCGREKNGKNKEKGEIISRFITYTNSFIYLI
jgi:hypothetical protein